MNNTLKNNSQRLASLDILRGADLFLLVFFQPVFYALAQQMDLPILNKVASQFVHAHWDGFRFWDLIMPLFMFMAGVSLPFSLSKYQNTSGKWPVYRRIVKRVVILFVLGIVVQGNLLSLDPNHIYLYTNTLQAIAVGYLIASMTFLHFSFKWQVAVAVGLLLLYWIPMTFLGDFTPTGNFAEMVDRVVLGRFRDGAYEGVDGRLAFSPDYTYTWVWSSLTFGVTVMLGMFAGTIIRRGMDCPKRVIKQLVVLGVLLLLAAYLWNLQMPINKRLWSGSMTLLSGGYCFLLMALFYYWIDYKGHVCGLNWLKIYGMNSIAAYVLGEVVDFRCVAHSICHGMAPYLGNYYAVWLTFCNFLILFFLLRAMYKCRLFLKV